MTYETADPLRTPGRLSPPSPSELVRARLAILGELENSLEASQKALLARDLEGIEQGTREQLGFERAFAGLGAHDAALRGDLAGGSARTQAGADLVSALRSAEMRVLHLARVQAALLARAQRSARIMANLLAGPQAAYGPDKESAASGLAAGR